MRAVRSSIALDEPPAADWPDFLAFLVGRPDDMVMCCCAVLLQGRNLSAGWLAGPYCLKTAMVSKFMM